MKNSQAVFRRTEKFIFFTERKRVYFFNTAFLGINKSSSLKPDRMENNILLFKNICMK